MRATGQLAMTASSLRDDAGLQEDAKLTRRFGQKSFRDSPLFLRNGADVHAEPGREHFRQQHKRFLLQFFGTEQGAHFREVRLLVLPLDIKLATVDFHWQISLMPSTNRCIASLAVSRS